MGTTSFLDVVNLVVLIIIVVIMGYVLTGVVGSAWVPFFSVALASVVFAGMNRHSSDLS